MQRRLRVLLVAINPPPAAAESGLLFATPSNMFWRLLHASGLTKRLYRPDEAGRLSEDGLGLMSLVERPTKTAAELRPAELRAGAERLARSVRRARPAIVAPLGLTIAPYLLPDASGPGLQPSTFAGARVFVLPNPSGRNRSYPGFDAKLVWYRALGDASQGASDSSLMDRTSTLKKVPSLPPRPPV